MFKRLIFAVFVMGLILTLSGTAISGIGQKEGLNPVVFSNPNAPLFGVALEDARPATSSYKIPDPPGQMPAGGGDISAPSGYYCDVLADWCDTTYYVWYWTLTGEPVVAHRFTVEGLDVCTVMVGWARFLTLSGYMTGTPGVTVYLYQDDGFGFPGVILDSVHFDHDPGWFGSTFTWFGADFVTDGNNNGGNYWVFGNGDEFHIGARFTGTLGVDYIPPVSDQAQPWPPHSGQLRSTVSNDGGATWGTMFDASGGDDAQWQIEAEFCGYETPFSDCYDQMYADDGWYIWYMPHPSYGFDQWAERFSTAGPETLQFVEVGILEWWEAGDPAGAGDGSNDLIVTVYEDDGGLPGTAISTVTIPGGTYPFYPDWAYADFSTTPEWPIIIDGEFHVSIATSAVFGTGAFEVLYGDDELSPTGRGSLFDTEGLVVPGIWFSTADMYGIDVDFKIRAHLCIDPYSECGNYWYYTGHDYFWYLPDTYGSTAQAQRIKALGEDCRIYEVSFYLWDDGGANPDAYSLPSTVSIYADGLGGPAFEMASIDVSTYSLYPGKTTVDFGPLDVHTSGYYWVAIESQSPDQAHGIMTMSDFGGSAFNYGYAELWDGNWGLMTNNWVGLPTDIAMSAEATHCCIPLDAWPCQTPHDWSTSAYNAARTGHADVTFGAPEADLTYNWSFEHPVQQCYFADPVVYDGKIVCAFWNEYKVFDLETGADLLTIGADMFSPDNIRTTPLIAEVGGVATLFASSGAGQGMYAYNLNSGAQIWAFDLLTSGILAGAMRYNSFQVANVGGTDVVFLGTDDGNIFALDAATGALFPDWTVNPITVTFPVQQSGAFDGANLYYATEAAGFDCDVYSISAADGSINWTLATGIDGLQANALYPTEAVAGEVFRSGVSYNNGVLYANSYVSDGDHPADGVFYAINTADGSVKYAVPSARSMFTTPVIDQNQIYVAFYSRWLAPPIGGNLAAFNRKNGAVNWIFTHPNDDGYYADLALTCEADTTDAGIVSDILFAGGHKSFLSCIETVDGTEVFNRQINWGDPFNSMWNGIALVEGDGVDYDHHLVASEFWGGLVVLSTDMTRTVRPRLEIQSYNPQVAVEFGVATSLHTTLPAMLTNTGGAPLTINDIWTDETCFGYHPEFSSVRPDVAEEAMKIAARLTGDVIVKAPQINDPIDELNSVRDARGSRVLNAGAMAIPAFIQTATDPDGIISPVDGTIINVGDTIDIVVDVNQSLINRGPQPFAMYVVSDDPDFYLNPDGALPMAYPNPCIYATIIGGCLLDTTFLTFGMGCGNTQTVYNTGRIATGDDWADPWGFDIDGDNQSIFQGCFLYAVDQYSIALNTQAWHGEGEESAYISMQPDPNWYDGECKAPLVEGEMVSCLGGYTEDGDFYTPIYGSFVAKSFIDSVQNFDDGGGWDWTWFGAPFDYPLTMGLYVNTRTIGVCDFEPLKDLTLEIFEMTERNGNAVTDWKFGATMDYDLGGDFANMFADLSVCAVYDPAGDASWGMIKVPYGCNTLPAGAGYTTTFDPVKNAKTMYGNGAWWDDIYLDSAYAFMVEPAGVTSQDPGVGGDEEAHFTLVEHDFAGNETFTFAIAQFGLHGMADPGDAAEYAPVSSLVNKWAGFNRGDVNNDGVVDLRDLVYLKNYVYEIGPGPIPFKHLGDVNADDAVDQGDIDYLFAWYFNAGPCPLGDWCF